jgi:tRNA/tmRNA/rRNA uracil-C5-methylase (TrmA/RlmC/RlmD family)
LPIARYAKHVVGVEGDSGLIERAKENAQSYITKKSKNKSVATDIRAIFNAPNGDCTYQSQTRILISKYFSHFCALLDTLI